MNFLNRGILIPAKVTGENSLENEDLGTIKGNFIKHYPKGSNVQLLLQPEDLEHDDKSNLKLEVVDRKFRGTNFIYTCLLYTSPSPRDKRLSRMPSSA